MHPPGSVLRHRFDLMFSQIGLNPPQNVVNTNNFLAISSLLLQSDMLAVLPDEVARQYQQYRRSEASADRFAVQDGYIRYHHAPVAPAVAGGHGRARSLAGSRWRGLRHRLRTDSGAINASPVVMAAGDGAGGTDDVQQTRKTATRRRRFFSVRSGGASAWFSNGMALKSTIYKAELQIANMDRHYYADHSLTIARHPSETDERMMVRVAAFALFAQRTPRILQGFVGHGRAGSLAEGSDRRDRDVDRSRPAGRTAHRQGERPLETT